MGSPLVGAVLAAVLTLVVPLGPARAGESPVPERDAGSTSVAESDQITMISTGANHSCAATPGGQIWCWGKNTNGELGNGTTTDSRSAVPVTTTGTPLTGQGIAQIAAGDHHTCALTTSGAVACWGSRPALGVGSSGALNRTTPTAVTTTGVLSGKTVAQIAAGNDVSCAVTTDGIAACWGVNFSGQVGDGTGSNRDVPTAVKADSGPLAGKQVLMVATGDRTTCAITTTGSAACWGSNVFGQLGAGIAVTYRLSPVSVVVPSFLTNKDFTSIAVGNSHACVTYILSAHACWGRNNHGQLGDHTTTDSSIPVKTFIGGIDEDLGDDVGCNRSGGKVWCLGSNQHHLLGTADESADSGSTVPIPMTGSVLEGKRVRAMSAGGHTGCAVATDNTVACWGDGGEGQRGDGTTNQASTPDSAVSGVLTGTVAEVDGGDDFYCARGSFGVGCWGENVEGQLGDGSETDRSSAVALTTAGTPLAGQTITQVSAAGDFACALTSLGSVSCWGDGHVGALGTGTSDSSPIPVAVKTTGGPLATRTVAEVATGHDHACALTTDGSVVCWGFNLLGQLGRASTSIAPALITTTGTVLEGKAVVDLATSHESTCVLTSDSIVACFGGNKFGELANGTTDAVEGTKVATQILTAGTPLDGKTITTIAGGSGYGFCAKTSDGILGCWGDGPVGDGSTSNATKPVQVATAGTPLAGTSAHQVDVGQNNACISTATGVATCWGWQYEGMVGNGVDDPGTVATAVPVWTAGTPLAGKTVQDIATSMVGACAAAADLVSCWGRNDVGQHGNGTTGFFLGPRLVLGLPAPSTDVPWAPTAARAVAAGPGAISVNWHPADDAGSPVTAYWVTPYIGGVAQTAVKAGTIEGQAKVVSGLQNGTVYTFKIAAENANGIGPLSGASNPETPYGVPDAPTIGAVVAGDSQVTVNWTPPAFDGGRPVTAYWVTPVIGGVAQPGTLVPPSTSKVMTGLANGTTYRFKVAASNLRGIGAESALSDPVTPTGPPAPTVPGAPTIGTATRGNGQATVTWTAPASDGGSPITGYVVTPYLGVSAQTPVSSPGTGTSKVVTGLINGQPYTFKVSAVNAVGTGAQSAASNEVKPAKVPDAPTIGAVTRGDGNAMVTWTAPASDGGLPLTGYVVTPYVGGVAQTPVNTGDTFPWKVVTGLTNGTSYTFKVAAANAVGAGPQSAASGAVVPRPPFWPFANWTDFVKRQVLDMTATPATSGEVGTWVPQLGTGAKTKGDLIEALRRGTDNTKNVDPAARLYRAFLGRAPDAGGLKFWIARRRTGAWNLTRMADHFSRSSEFKTKYGTLTNRQFVTRIYTDVLGRTADTAGVNYWTGRLDAKAKSRGQVMVGFSESSEYKRKQAENTDVAIAYIFLMGRAATTAETTDWVTRQKGGTAQAVLASELLDSAGYESHVNG